MKNENDMACEEGEYKDFTGVLLWGGNEALVESANFHLVDRSNLKFIVFHSGTCKNGFFDYSFWHSGTWESGTWNDGVWERGTWNGGIWNDGTWIGGVGRDGKFHETNPITWSSEK